MLLLSTTVKSYAWGRTDGIAALVGSEPTGGPEAELWVGTHPAGPSVVVGDPEGRTLAEVIASDPRRWLGPDLAGAGFTALPFLLKVLAIGQPLSLQAHPSTPQAEAGFDREEANGISLDDPGRTYRDRSAKPEALVSLTDTWAMCGFRPTEEAVALVEELDLARLAPLSEHLGSGRPNAMEEAFAWLLGTGSEVGPSLAAEIAQAAKQRVAVGDDRADPFRWTTELSALHPDDPTILSPLLLNVVHLAEGDAVHLPAGNLHAYLSGAGVEVMSASDNVLRGGLTPKHVDVDELLSIVRFEPGVPRPPRRLEPERGVTVFDAGESSFALALIEAGGEPVVIDPQRPSILLAIGGEVDVAGADSGVTIDGGAAAFVAPGEGPLAVSGPGHRWWATVGDGLPT